jgi:hypothetical protein
MDRPEVRGETPALRFSRRSVFMPDIAEEADALIRAFGRLDVFNAPHCMSFLFPRRKVIPGSFGRPLAPAFERAGVFQRPSRPIQSD